MEVDDACRSGRVDGRVGRGPGRFERSRPGTRAVGSSGLDSNLLLPARETHTDSIGLGIAGQFYVSRNDNVSIFVRRVLRRPVLAQPAVQRLRRARTRLFLG